VKTRKASIDTYLRELKNSDADLYAEMEAAQDKMFTIESAAGRSDSFTRETIVLTIGRPVLDIKANAVVVSIADIASQIWKQRLIDANPLLLPNVPAVGRIELVNHPRGIEWIGTGWLLRDDIVVTNRHVAEIFGESDGTKFLFRPGFEGGFINANIDFLEEFEGNGSLEFPLFKIIHIERGGGPDLAFLRIEPVSGLALPKPVALSSTPAGQGDQVAVIGYPARDPFFPDPKLMDDIFNNRYDKKRLAPGLVTQVTRDRIFHDCSTLGGNSGGEVVSLKTGQAVALHFAGTLFSKNHAVPIDIVASRLDDVLAGRNFRSTHNPVNDSRELLRLQSTVSSPSSARILEATIPIKIRIEIGEMLSATVPLAGKPQVQVDADDDDHFEAAEARPEEYLDRKGYNPKFIGSGFEVPLPILSQNRDDVLKFTFGGKLREVLDYQHFSILMSASRRICRFSACNIDGKNSKRKQRTGWQFDPRIARTAQIMKECYGNLPKFSRGHMTRREDPVWGSDDAASLGNSDSMHVTNTVPQIQPFNAGVWLSLEDYALQNARKDNMRICVFTGPFLADNDPIRFGVKIPITFWKVIAFVHDETHELCATGYTMSQKSFIGEEEFVFGRHENNQRSIVEIEKRTGISFGSLGEVDPLKDSDESTPVLLTQLNQIRFLR
jgi:endonuclease G, mitochondrial